MLLIPCPICGLRGHEEFLFHGVEEAAPRPDADTNAGSGANTERGGARDSESAWYEHVYLRGNPRGAGHEHWQHIHGCREWLVVERDTLTHEILSAALARTARTTRTARTARTARTDKNNGGGA